MYHVYCILPLPNLNQHRHRHHKQSRCTCLHNIAIVKLGSRTTECWSYLETLSSCPHTSALPAEEPSSSGDYLDSLFSSSPSCPHAPTPQPATTNTVNYDVSEVRKEIKSLLDNPSWDDGSLAPIFLRLAWHSSGTYDKASGTGGSNGAGMRFATEAADPEKCWS